MEKDIDFLSYYFCFLRNKFKIILLTIFFGFGGVLYSLSLQRVWEGSFEIVMESPADPIQSSNPGDFYSDLFLNDDNLAVNRTELEILRSPLVLTPVYEYYNQLLKDKNPNYGSISYEKVLSQS